MPGKVWHESKLMQFLTKRENASLWITKTQRNADKSIVITHTFLDATFTGSLRIPPTKSEEFYAAVARDVRDGTLPPLNELRTDVFRFFVDVDAHLKDAALSVATRDAIASACIREIARFVPSDDLLKCVVLCVDDAKDGETGLTKRGMHLHFPRLNVSTNEALRMREGLVVALKRCVSEDVNWVDDIDNSPYVNATGGLRMVGSVKAKKCPECRNVERNRASCVACFGSGHLYDMNRKYALHSVLDRNGEPDEATHRFLSGNCAALVQACSIRSDRKAVCSAWEAYPGCPSFSAVRVKQNAPPEAGSRKRSFTDESASLRKWPKAAVVDERKRLCLREIFRTRFVKMASGVYRNVDISTVKYNSRSNTYYAQFCDEGEGYCMNVGRNHTSNRVYGVVDHHSAYIRCHSSATATHDRISGSTCKAFRSPGVLLTRENVSILFGSQHDMVDPACKKSRLAPKAPMTNEDYLANLSRTLHAANSVAKEEGED